jgi:hypothetical protein
MAIGHEFHASHRNAEIFQDALNFLLRYPPVGVNNERTLDGVKHDPPPRPLLIFRVTLDVGDALRGAPCSPAFPDVVMAVWAGEELSVFLSVG